MLYSRCTNYILSISKKDAIRFDCDIHQQLDNIEVYHIYIFNIAEYNAHAVVICYRLSLCSCLFGYDAKPHPLYVSLDDTYILVLDTN